MLKIDINRGLCLLSNSFNNIYICILIIKIVLILEKNGRNFNLFDKKPIKS